MKKYLIGFIFILLTLLVILFSCSDDEGDNLLPSNVTITIPEGI